MKIALMSGAYVNAGDFLIEQRCKDLLEAFIDDADVRILKRNLPYDGRIDELNQYDLIVFGGGPGYQKNLYPDKMPFVSDLDKIITPVVIMGWGWKGKAISPKAIYRSSLSDPMKKFIECAERSGCLGCRDWYTLRFLKNQGFQNLMMTGCPVWYDLKSITDLHVKHNNKKRFENIHISDASFRRNKQALKMLIFYLRTKYPEAKIKLIFHRGISKDDHLILNSDFIEQYQLEYTDISGGSEGFSIYDNCDLHIGFRVHAHIYNLSKGNISILLNEDARGIGVNDALGIMNIALDSSKICIFDKVMGSRSRYLYKILDDYFQYIYDTNFLQYENACRSIQYYYRKMKLFVENLDRF